jgi:hypothetical protein
LTDIDIEAALRAAGVPTTPATRAELLAVLPLLDAMRSRVRMPPAAEPAVVFAPEPRG